MRFLLVLLVLVACRDATSPSARFDGTYVLTSPVPYNRTIDQLTYSVRAETLFVYGGDALYEQHFLVTLAGGAPTLATGCCGPVYFTSDSIQFTQPGQPQNPTLGSGALNGNTLIVHATNGGFPLGWNFVFTRVH